MALQLHAYIEQPGAAPDDRPNVLLADDEPAKRFALAEALQGLEHNLFVAGHGRDVLRLLLKRRYAVMLLDVKMAGIDGFEIARLVRGRPHSRHTPIIFISAHRTDDVDMQLGYALGAVDYLVAPVSPSVLRTKVGVFLEIERLRRELAEARRRLEELARIPEADF
jgi:CheY-like chemotaxis protein